MDNIPVYTQLDPPNSSISDWAFIEPVDEVIEELVVNKNFLAYIDSTNKKIIKNPSHYYILEEISS